MKNIKIKIPEGYQIDQEKSTFENIVFKEVVKPKFQIGDYVKIIDWGENYPIATEMARGMNFELSKCCNKNHIIGYVFDCIPHIHDKNVLVYGVETATSKVLMDGRGLVALTQEEKEEYFKSFTEGDDWFTVFFDWGSRKWICQGDVFAFTFNKHFSVKTGAKCTYGRLSAINSVSSIRKSTQEEIDLVKKEAPEWFKPDYGIGDFVIATSGTKDQLKYIGIYGGKINNSTEEVKQYFTLGEGTYFTGLDGVFNKIVRKANKEEMKIWLDAASRYYGS